MHNAQCANCTVHWNDDALQFCSNCYTTWWRLLALLRRRCNPSCVRFPSRSHRAGEAVQRNLTILEPHLPLHQTESFPSATLFTSESCCSSFRRGAAGSTDHRASSMKRALAVGYADTHDLSKDLLTSPICRGMQEKDASRRYPRHGQDSNDPQPVQRRDHQGQRCPFSVACVNFACDDELLPGFPYSTVQVVGESR
jgi:hypothetical protein